MSKTYVQEVARLHAAALAGDFLPSLGEPFLRVFYRAALESGMAFGFVDTVGKRVRGFVLGSLDTSSLFRQVVLRAAPELGRAALPALLKRPGLLLKVAETFLYPAREAEVRDKTELLVIAVEAEARSRGLGAALVQALNSAFRQHRARSYKVTVLQSNAGANRFYQRLGFQLCGQFRLYGKGWNIYSFRISD
jgi:ribosomal protein S18 acetylase RimI-like enzyme